MQITFTEQVLEGDQTAMEDILLKVFATLLILIFPVEK